MSVTKRIINKNTLNKTNVGNTIISFTLMIIGSLVMLYIGLKYIGSSDEIERIYAMYAFVMVFFGLSGLFTADYYDNRKINIIPKIEDLNEFNTFLYLTATLIMFIISAIAEAILVIKMRLALSDTDFILYAVFAGVCEEAFFRKFLINMIIRLNTGYNEKPNVITLIIALFVSSFAFMAIHLGVYGSDPIMLTSTLIGGFILGIGYIVFRDISANISAHCLKNTIGVINLVRFG